MSQALLNLRDLSCGYPEHKVVQHLNLHLNAGDIGCLLGPSGCGKTTTLRAIAGFEPVHQGEIRLAGEVISSAGFTLAPEKRRIGMVFQDHNLLDDRSVFDNVALPLIINGLDVREIPRRVHAALDLVGLAHRAKDVRDALRILGEL